MELVKQRRNAEQRAVQAQRSGHLPGPLAPHLCEEWKAFLKAGPGPLVPPVITTLRWHVSGILCHYCPIMGSLACEKQPERLNRKIFSSLPQASDLLGLLVLKKRTPRKSYCNGLRSMCFLSSSEGGTFFFFFFLSSLCLFLIPTSYLFYTL